MAKRMTVAVLVLAGLALAVELVTLRPRGHNLAQVYDARIPVGESGSVRVADVWKQYEDPDAARGGLVVPLTRTDLERHPVGSLVWIDYHRGALGLLVVPRLVGLTPAEVERYTVDGGRALSIPNHCPGRVSEN